MKMNEIVKAIINASLSEDILLKLVKEKRLLEVYDGKTILDYILEYRRNTKEFDRFAVYDVEIAKKYLDYGLNPNIDSEEIFMSKYDEKKTIFEKHIEKHFDTPFLNIITNLIKDGRNLKEILSCKIDNKYVFEHLEERGLNTTITYTIVANDKKVAFEEEIGVFFAKYAFDHRDFVSALQNESFLFEKDKVSGDIYLDIIIRELLKTGKILSIIDIKYTGALLTHRSKYLGNMMLIEYIIKMCSIDILRRYNISRYLLYMLDERTTLLDFLIRNNRDFFIENLYPKLAGLKNEAINSILRANKIDTNKFIIFQGTLVDVYLERMAEQQCGGEISYDESQLLNAFSNLLNQNVENNKKLIELAVKSFKRQFVNGVKYAYRDLQTLIELIKQGKLYLKLGNASQFLNSGIIFLSSPYYISDFEHEITHLLHYFTVSNAKPYSFDKYMSFSPLQIEKIVNFIKVFHCQLDFLRDSLEQTVIIEPLVKKYYDSYTSEVKSAIELAQDNIDVPSDYLLNIMESESEFLSLLQIDNHEAVVNKICCEKFDIEFALENLFDALSYGRFFTTGIDYKGEHIQIKIGHGISYFLDDSPFLEIIACYGEIIKSPRREYGLAILKDVMGQEFIDMLDEFYANMYLKDLDYKTEGVSYGL